MENQKYEGGLKLPTKKEYNRAKDQSWRYHKMQAIQEIVSKQSKISRRKAEIRMLEHDIKLLREKKNKTI